MACDELRGGRATMEFGSDSREAVPALSQIGVCCEYTDSAQPGGRQECAWYPLETVPYYRVKK